MPKVGGSGIRPALVRRDMHLKLLSLYIKLGFHHHILICQVWARDSKVTAREPCSQYYSKSGIPVIHN